ncbi:CUE domain-containing protein 1-like isoform X2 [Acanthaster planci]|uniref:CUE domain-containing protein 1-like isoform X2 n=1 Tax=Acanthaster planci TaxID=133434 RepID=A0A8B7ZBN0_ACAPL|nr:CUE domain-containing protein 1-like isoform X2 [Acanthaster planci]
MATAPDMQHPPSGKSKKSKKKRSHSVPTDQMMANNAGMGGAVGGTPPPAPPTRQLEFNQAMADFKVMFPSMDRAVIETVLRANNGAVDATIDQLLTLTADMPEVPQRPPEPQLPKYSDTMNNSFSNPPVGMIPITPVSGVNPMMSTMHGDQPPPYSPPSPNSPFSQDIRNRQLPPTPQQRGPAPTPPQSTSSPMPLASQPPPTTVTPRQAEPREPTRVPPTLPTYTAPRRVHPRWNPPLLGELPSDFLRVVSTSNRQRSRSQPMISMNLQERMARNAQQQSSADANDVEMQQMLEDERFALTLQNEEFLRELQHNPEFIAALDRDYTQALAASTTPGAVQAPTPQPSVQSTPVPPQQSATGPLPPGGGASAAGGGTSADDVEFRNKLAHMGKTTRFKFAQMAKKFNYRKRRSTSRPQIEGAPASSMMNLLDDYDESGDSALLGTRPTVEENVYSDTQPQRI